MKRQAALNQAGFVLVATIWVLAGLAMFVAFMAVQVDRSQTQALQIQTSFEQRLAQRATLSTLLYLASTRPFNYAGIRADRELPGLSASTPFDSPSLYTVTGDELRLDGRMYQGLGSTLFRVQDAGSLISLRSRQLTTLQRYLEAREVPREAVSLALARLQDYTDRDELLHLNGAEHETYVSNRLLPPTNRYLLSPVQLLNVYQLEQTLGAGLVEDLIEQSTIYIADRENFNSMTKQRLSSLPGLDPEASEKVVAARKTDAFSTVHDVNKITGSLIPYNPMQAGQFPSGYLRITLCLDEQRQCDQLGITLTPESPLAPWQIDYIIALPLKTAPNHEQALAETPKSTLFKTAVSAGAR